MRERALGRGAISVEIAARFDGSVLSVHHLVVGPRGATAPTRLLFAVGAVALCATIALLVAAAHGAGGPACTIAFAAAVLVAASSLPLAWLRRLDERQPRDFTVGPGRGADLPVAAHLSPEPRFALVRMTGDGFELRSATGAARPIELDDRLHVILGRAELEIRAALPPRRYRLAPATRWLERLREGTVGAWIAVWLCIVLPIGVAMLAAAHTWADRAHTLVLDPGDAVRVRIALGPEETPRRELPPPPPPQHSPPPSPSTPKTRSAASSSSSSSSSSSASRASSAAAARASRASVAEVAHARVARAEDDHTQTSVAQLSRDEAQRLARARALRAPLLGMFRSAMEGGSFALAGGASSSKPAPDGSATAESKSSDSKSSDSKSSDSKSSDSNSSDSKSSDSKSSDSKSSDSKTGESTTGASSDGADGMGSLSGDEVGEAYGVGGLGLVGSGAGGGGSEDTIGLGNLGTLGHGGGSGSGEGYGMGSGLLGGRVAHATICTIGEAEVLGGLDKEIIRRVVRAHINEVRFCYEQALQSEPTLEGRVRIGFTIAESGAVIAALVEGSTLSREEVGSCVAKAVRRWVFPSVKRHAVTEVHYPFALHVAD